MAGGGQEIERVHLPRHPQKRQSSGERNWTSRRSGRSSATMPPGWATRTLLPTMPAAPAPASTTTPKLRSKQIQFLLGHDKLDTTARSVNDEQKFGGEAVSKVADIS